MCCFGCFSWCTHPICTEIWISLETVPAHFWNRSFEALAIIIALILAAGYNGSSWADFAELQECETPEGLTGVELIRDFWWQYTVVVQAGLSGVILCVICNIYIGVVEGAPKPGKTNQAMIDFLPFIIVAFLVSCIALVSMSMSLAAMNEAIAKCKLQLAGLDDDWADLMFFRGTGVVCWSICVLLLVFGLVYSFKLTMKQKIIDRYSVGTPPITSDIGGSLTVSRSWEKKKTKTRIGGSELTL